MRIAIVGSRNINNYELVNSKIKDFILQHNLEMSDIEFLAEWDKYGKSAGFIRNELIWEYSDCGIAFWDGISKGTQHSFKLAEKYNKKIDIIRVEVKK